MSENKEIPELKKEMLADFYLYECNHVTDGTYMPHGILPVGRYANILVCKHCWQNLQAMFLADMFREMVAGNPGEPLRDMLSSLIAQMADTPRLHLTGGKKPQWQK